ncbi:hypothetical protein [Phenylobacterium sp.]|uniref:hypothetical protein n=1 Tax=Phenylobacterium sp. TaxID=1871053 RepID=UPI0025E36F38|nr:hypothetical protein [Phenylobacterium sp.]MBX3485792.1 hypothetical protein [Phenylobacterium sp.]MCW5760145.1 hypothetical protein [Phenylobacterium sp.]
MTFLLPSYSPSSRVQSAEGKQDKVVVELGRWYVHTTALDRFTDALAAVPFIEGEGTFLNRPRGGRTPDHRRVLHIRAGGRGRGRPVGAPLLSGQVQVRRSRGDDDFPGLHLAVTASIAINPTRFVTHQLSRPFVGRALSEWPPLLRPSLAARRVPYSTPSEFILDNSDNVLLTSAAQSFGRSEAWPLHLECYWAAIFARLSSVVEQAADDAGGVVGLYRADLNLREAETYWEFAADDPTTLVRDLERPLFEWARKPQARRFAYPVGLLTTALAHNSRQVSVQVRSGVRLRVYAKTTRRVRFEIIHDLQENSRPLGRHTSNDVRDLLRWLPVLQEDAGSALNHVLDHVECLSVFPPGGFTAAAMVRQISEACGADADAMLALLVGNGSLRVEAHDPIRPNVLALVAVGLLERTGAAYTVRAPYRRAFAELRGVRRAPRH